jgi:PIN domain nuclease of toxin-antitoxin system
VSHTDLPGAVLDASALLAFIYGEAGAGRVEPILRRGVLMSTVNWAETLSDMAERGEAIDESVPRVSRVVAKIGTLDLVPFDEAQAAEAARLRPLTKSLGLSLADRSCLALGRLRRLPVFTTDRAWRSLHISLEIEVIR